MANTKNTDSKKYYFGIEQENAVRLYRDYHLEDNYRSKNKVYETFLHEPLTQMSKSILRRYLHTFTIGNNEIEDIELDALHHLIENLPKFDEHKPSVLFIKNNSFDKYEDIVFTIKTINGVIMEIDIENKDIDRPLLHFGILGSATIYKNNTIRCKVEKDFNKTNGSYYKIVTIDDVDQAKYLKEYYCERKKYSNGDSILEKDVDKYVDIIKLSKRKVIYVEVNNYRSAFSYCQTIIKNYFNSLSKEESKKQKRDEHYDYFYDLDDYDSLNKDLKEYEIVKEEINHQELINLFLYDLNFINNNNVLLTKDNSDYKISDAIIEILTNKEIYFPELYDNTNENYLSTTTKFLKKKFQFILTEYTRVSSKDLTKAIKKINKTYKNSKEFFISNENNS